MPCVNGTDSETGLPCRNNNSTGPTGPTGNANPLFPTYNINPAAAATRAQADKDMAALAKLKYETIDLPKYNFNKAQDEADTAAKKLGTQQQYDYYNNLLTDDTAFRKDTDAFLELLNTYQDKATGKEGVGGQYDALSAALSGAATTGKTLTKTAYDSLKTYLDQNQPRAFADAQRATVTPQTNLIAQYARQRGIATPGVEQAVQEANVLAEGGAQNYNNLLGILTTLGNRAQTSRGAEGEMARTLANERITARENTGLAQLGLQKTQALSAIINQYNTAKLSAENNLLGRRQAIEDAIAKLKATGLLPVKPSGPGNSGGSGPSGPTVPTVAEVLAQIAASQASGNYNAFGGERATDQPVIDAAAAQNISPQFLEDILRGGQTNAVSDRYYFV